MANLTIHDFDQILKELENDIGRLNVQMHQAFILVKNIRCKHLLFNEECKVGCRSGKK